jgi:hypothetical protein
MITGFNANVCHRGRVFHVQTEDSGRAHPHVITHVYHEGTILASERRDYAHLADAADLTARVRRLMEDQHEAMVARLRRGEFDAAIDARLARAGRAPGAHRAPSASVLAAGTPAAAPAAGAPTPVPAAGAPTPVPAAGAPTPVPAAGATARASATPPVGRPRAFGEGIVSRKPLDEVILEYLVEKSRSRTRTAAARGSRSDG